MLYFDVEPRARQHASETPFGFLETAVASASGKEVMVAAASAAGAGAAPEASGEEITRA